MTRRASIQIAIGLAAAALWLPCTLFITAGANGQFWLDMGTFFSIPLVAFVAAPIVYLLRRRLSFLLCCTLGIAIGFLGYLVFFLMMHPRTVAFFLCLFLLAGLSSAVVFWLIGIRWNRDLAGGWSGREQ